MTGIFYVYYGISQSEDWLRFPDVVVKRGLVVDGELTIVHESYKKAVLSQR